MSDGTLLDLSCITAIVKRNDFLLSQKVETFLELELE